MFTYVSPIGGFSVFFTMSYFVKIILVQLSHKASKVAMLEVLGQDGLRKLLILFDKLSA